MQMVQTVTAVCRLQAASSAHSESVSPGWVLFKEREADTTALYRLSEISCKTRHRTPNVLLIVTAKKKLALANLFLNLRRLL